MLQIALAGLLVAAGGHAQESDSYPPMVWPSRPPADCPFPQSKTIARVQFTGRHREYANADCWFPSWASDGNMYSPFSDGTVERVLPDGSRELVKSLGAAGPICSVGYGKIVGDDPLDLEVIGLGALPTRAEPYASRYPSGSLVHDGIWYYGSHTEGGGALVRLDDEPYAWPWVCPLVGFRISRDYGKTWTETPNDPLDPLFPELAIDEDGVPQYGPIRIGEPFFVDFGKNMEHSPDGKAYLTAHGAAGPGPVPGELNASWCIGDSAYLLRVTPTPENINDASKYEFFGGHDVAGKPVWTRSLAKMKPLLTWPGRVGCASMTYNPKLEKYLFCITDGRAANGPYDTYILESANITGPWNMVVFMQSFGEQGYFVNIPSKFISSDGRTAWLCYAANFSGNTVPLKSSPPGSHYCMNLQEITLMAGD